MSLSALDRNTYPTATFQFTRVPSSIVGDNAGISTTMCSGRSSSVMYARNDKETGATRIVWWGGGGVGEGGGVNTAVHVANIPIARCVVVGGLIDRCQVSQDAFPLDEEKKR